MLSDTLLNFGLSTWSNSTEYMNTMYLLYTGLKRLLYIVPCTLHGYSILVKTGTYIHMDWIPFPYLHWSKQVKSYCTRYMDTLYLLYTGLNRVSINCTVNMDTQYLLYTGLYRLLYTVQRIPCTNCVQYTI